jgi:hypothetical protein
MRKFLSPCTDCGQSPPVNAHAVCILQAGSMRSFAFSTLAVACSSSGSSTGLSKQSGALITRDGSRQEIADIPRFAAPPGDAHRARGSLIVAPSQHAGCNTSANLLRPRSNYCAGFKRSRCVTLAPKPTWKSVSLTHILCRMLASLRATATIAHSMLDRLAIRRPHARNADHFLTRSRRLAAASHSASRTATSPCLVIRPS